jgi:hypothetical protein
MSKMKRDGRQARRRGHQFRFTQVATPKGQVFLGEFESVKHRARHSRDFQMSASQLRFRLGFLHGSRSRRFFLQHIPQFFRNIAQLRPAPIEFKMKQNGLGAACSDSEACARVSIRFESDP